MPAIQPVRKIVHIDEQKCNGCGQCVPTCAEGAIRIINGKAKLIADKLCDGLGACLGHCPLDAITIEERPADDFDEHAVQHAAAAHSHAPAFAPLPPAPHAPHAGGCPGSRMRILEPLAPTPAASQTNPGAPTQLRQWPVQLSLLPTSGPIWQNADLLLSADCVPFAYPDFHAQMLSGKTLAIACPKLDQVNAYVQKLATIFANNPIRSITIARMEVPCCYGLVKIVQNALQLAGLSLPVHELIVSVRGTIQPAH